MPNRSEIRTFDKKRFQFAYYRHDKRDAQADARKERENGWNARVVKRKIGIKTYYDVYLRRR